MFTSALQSTGLATNKASNSQSGIDALSWVSQSDKSQLSPFAQIMSELQKLQQSNPTKYSKVTQQISTDLQSAAQTASADGYPKAATQLNQLAADFKSSSTSGQLPNVQDLARAVRGHHHHHAQAASPDATSASATGSSSSNSASQALSQLLAAYQTNGAQSTATDPMSIIMNTMSSITGS